MEMAVSIEELAKWTLWFAISWCLCGCASLQDNACKRGEQFAIQDALYFGTGKPNGVVTRDEWNKFLETMVTPRFPQGLTVSDASGQWRGTDGSLVREASHVLTLVHPDDAPSEKSVAEIVASYKAQFQQEAVLRVKAGACMSF
jgi:Protein of unknown function (DUF3574)